MHESVVLSRDESLELCKGRVKECAAACSAPSAHTCVPSGEACVERREGRVE